MEILEMNIINKTIENLKKNKMDAYFVDTKEDVLPLIKSKFLHEGDTVSNGGSQSIKETGVMAEIKSGKYNYLDRAREGITPEEVQQVYRDTYSADVYFASSNAITENGELYNVDGNSNRVSAILFGPASVVLICGYNKIVKNIKEAELRVKTIAAPKNCKRFNSDTCCDQTGKCISLSMENSEIPTGCHSDKRICCNYVISAQQRHVNRIKVIIVGEKLGY